MELIKISEIKITLTNLEKSLVAHERNVYLFVLGNQTKKAIVTLPDYVQGIQLLWSGWSGPGWVRLFFFLTAGYGGLFKILDGHNIKEIALEASRGGLVQILITRTAIDRELVELITENGVNPHLIQENVKWGYDNALIEISCDTNETLDSEGAGYFSSRGYLDLQS